MILILRKFLLVTFLCQSLLFVEIQAYRNEATYMELENIAAWSRRLGSNSILSTSMSFSMSMSLSMPIPSSTPVPVTTTARPLAKVTPSPFSIVSKVPSFAFSSKVPTLSESASSVPVNQDPVPITQMPITNTPILPEPTMLPTREIVPDDETKSPTHIEFPSVLPTTAPALTTKRPSLRLPPTSVPSSEITLIPSMVPNQVEISSIPSQLLVPVTLKTASPSIEPSGQSSFVPSEASPAPSTSNNNTSSPSIQFVNDDDASNDSPALISFPSSMPTLSSALDTISPSLQVPTGITLAPVSPVDIPVSDATVTPSIIPTRFEDSTGPSQFPVPVTSKTQFPSSKPTSQPSLRPFQKSPVSMPIVTGPTDSEETPSYINDDDASNDSPAFVEFPSSSPRTDGLIR